MLNILTNTMKMDKDTSKTNLIIVDDHQMFIDGIKTMLRYEKSIQIVGEALNGEEALKLIETNPKNIDIVIADISMPVMGGIELTKRIKSDYPHIKVLVLSMYKDEEIVREIAMAEAEGYILKNIGKDELFSALKKIMQDDDAVFYSSEVAKIIKGIDFTKDPKEKNKILLTKREKEILALVCKELTTKEIAEKLFIGTLGVETHRKNIKNKIQSKNLIGTIKWVLKNMPELLND